MKLPWGAWRKRRERELEEELDAHFALDVQQRMDAGSNKEDAEVAARREFGNLTRVKEVTRETWGWSFLEQVTQDVLHAIRRLRNAPAFLLTSVLTLALCLGANLTIFAVIDAILVRPLPFPDASRLVTIFNTYPKAGVERDGASITNYYERRGEIPEFSSLSIYRFGTAIIGEPGSTVRQPVTQVSPDFFRTLGSGPAMGRVFKDSETTYQTDRVAILTDQYWRERFHADPRILGQTVWVDSLPKTIVGVLPSGFRFLSSKAALYLPLSSRPEDRTARRRHAGGNVIQMIARLKPGATLEQAQSQIDAQNVSLEKDDPQAKMMADAGFRSLVVPLREDQVAAVRPMLLLLQVGVFVLLVIGAVNLINLLLIRASGRLKEFAVRQALGAGRSRLLTEILVETSLLSLLGGLLALIIGAGGIQLVMGLGAESLPLGDYIAFNTRSAVFALMAALALGVVLAAPIAWFSLRVNPAGALQSEFRGTTGSRAAQTLRHSFVIAQVALGFVLLVGAWLLGLSLKRVMEVSPGFRSDHAIAGQISLVGNRYSSPADGLVFTERLSDQLRVQPGVSAIGIANNIPFSGRNGKSAATAEDHVLRPGESPRGYFSYGVSGDYFEAMGLLLKAGRFLTSEDSHRKDRTCVVDEDFVRYNWPNTNPLGRHIFQGSERGNTADAFTVVGVVGSIKQAGLADDTAQGAVYYPYVDLPDSNIFVVVRGGMSTDILKKELQTVVRHIDPNLAVNDLESMSNRIESSLIGRRSPAILGSIFSAIALLLIAVGIYGVLSYAVTQRRREIAIRMAVGARPEDIRRQFLSLALRLLIPGMMFGLFGAWVLGRGMQQLLFHVPAHNLFVLVASAGAIAVISLGACLLPACRAAGVLPMQALADQ